MKLIGNTTANGGHFEIHIYHKHGVAMPTNTALSFCVSKSR